MSTPALAVEKGEVKTAILFSCSVAFHASGKSAYLGVGYTKIEGLGAMTCYDYVENVVEEIPLRVKIQGPGAGLGVTGLNVSGGQTGIGLNQKPEALLGKYLMVRGNAAVGIGGAVSTGLRVAKGAFQLALQIESTSGLGAGIDLLSVELEKDSKREVRRTAMPAPEKIAVETPAESALPATAAVITSAPVRVQLNQTVEVVDQQGHTVNYYRFSRQ